MQRPGRFGLQPGRECADPPGLQRGDPQMHRLATAATAAPGPPTAPSTGCITAAIVCQFKSPCLLAEHSGLCLSHLGACQAFLSLGPLYMHLRSIRSQQATMRMYIRGHSQEVLHALGLCENHNTLLYHARIKQCCIASHESYFDKVSPKGLRRISAVLAAANPVPAIPVPARPVPIPQPVLPSPLPQQVTYNPVQPSPTNTPAPAASMPMLTQPLPVSPLTSKAGYSSCPGRTECKVL